MVGLHEAGMDSGQVAAQPGVEFSARTVRRWANRFEAEGCQGLKTRPRPGRRKVVTQEEVQLLSASIMADPFRSLRDVVMELTPHLAPHMKTVYER